MLAKIVTLKRETETHMRLCEAPHSDHRAGCGAKERNRQGKTEWHLFLFFLSMYPVPAFCMVRGVGVGCHTGIHPAMPYCLCLLCYAMLCVLLSAVQSTPTDSTYRIACKMDRIPCWSVEMCLQGRQKTRLQNNTPAQNSSTPIRDPTEGRNYKKNRIREIKHRAAIRIG